MIPTTLDQSMPPAPTYSITRERVAWIRWDKQAMRQRTSHPMQYVVTEHQHDDAPGDPGEWVKSLDTKREALAWIAAQGAEVAAA